MHDLATCTPDQLAESLASHAGDHEQHAEDKVHRVMSEFKHGELKSGSKEGPQVTDRKQAVAIALNEARKEGEHVAPKKD